MKAYYIGGSMDQMKEIVEEPPEKLKRQFVREPLPMVAPLSEEMNQHGSLVEIHYHYYRLWKIYCPWNDEEIAIYVYDETMETPRQRVRNGVKR